MASETTTCRLPVRNTLSSRPAVELESVVDPHRPPIPNVPDMLHRRSSAGRWICVLWLIATTAGGSMAQESPAAGQRGPGPRPGGKVEPKADATEKPPTDGEKGDGKSEDSAKGEASEKKEDSPPTVLKRQEVVKAEADPAELKAKLDDDRRVAFHFRNQGWVDLIGWLSDIAGEPIDWQTLPADQVNLVSPRKLTVDETIDLFNRHLLARGFTLLQLDGGITISPTASINPGLVRRVDVDDLSKLPDHTYVRVILDAGWLSAEKLTTELKPMLGGGGELTALATTNRIEARGAAANLRQIASLLDTERDAASRDALAPEFRLRHLPAEEAKRMLEEFLGVDNKPPPPMTPEQMQAMQRMRQQQGGDQPPPEPKGPEISIVANPRQNSVLVRAPIDRIAVAAEFIKRIDVPGGSIQSLQDVGSRVDVMRLVSLDPEKLIEIAREMNVLEPTTRIRTDKENKAVIVSGSAADRFIIRSLIEKLDGGRRQLEVLQLRRLEADEVAQSIAFLMGQKDDDEKKSSRRSYYWSYRDNDEEEKEEDKFRVAANVRYRQVLLYANESEMEEVRSLLVKLGELPPPGGNPSTLRTIEAAATPETLQYLRQLQQQWGTMSDNPLVLPDDSEFREEKLEPLFGPMPDSDRPDAAKPVATPDLPDVTRWGGSLDVAEVAKTFGPPETIAAESLDDFRYLQQRYVLFQPPSPAPPPVQISVDDDGNLVLSSRDTAALDRLEAWMVRQAPPQKSYRVFRVRHASVALVVEDLQAYFKDAEEKDSSQADSFFRWYFGDDDDSDDKKKAKGLAIAGKMKFVPNSDTGTIIVTGATGEQLRTIGELIELWDVPEPINPRRSRFTKLVAIRYGKAETIAETVKDAYRDLLSSNDRAFQTRQNGRGRGGGDDGETSNRRRGSGLEDSESGSDGGGQDFKFNGKLSLGVDPIGNTLLVSAEGEPLLDLIVEMISKLDTAAEPTGQVEVVQLSGNVSSEVVQKVLTMMSTGEKASDRSGPARPSRGNRDSGRDTQ